MSLSQTYRVQKFRHYEVLGADVAILGVSEAHPVVVRHHQKGWSFQAFSELFLVLFLPVGALPIFLDWLAFAVASHDCVSEAAGYVFVGFSVQLVLSRSLSGICLTKASKSA